MTDVEEVCVEGPQRDGYDMGVKDRAQGRPDQRKRNALCDNMHERS